VIADQKVPAIKESTSTLRTTCSTATGSRPTVEFRRDRRSSFGLRIGQPNLLRNEMSHDPLPCARLFKAELQAEYQRGLVSQLLPANETLQRHSAVMNELLNPIAQPRRRFNS
jgi:hypothetical protein